MENKIHVCLLKMNHARQGTQAVFLDIENDLASFQGLVGGYIEVVTLGDGICLVCNEEGKLLNMRPVAFLNADGKPFDTINGDCILCRADDDGEFASLDEEEMHRKWQHAPRGQDRDGNLLFNFSID